MIQRTKKDRVPILLGSLDYLVEKFMIMSCCEQL